MVSGNKINKYIYINFREPHLRPRNNNSLKEYYKQDTQSFQIHTEEGCSVAGISLFLSFKSRLWVLFPSNLNVEKKLLGLNTCGFGLRP